jgi:hypothetical protein
MDKHVLGGFQENLRMKWLFLDNEVATSDQDAKYLTKLQQLLRIQPEIGSDLIIQLNVYLNNHELQDAQVSCSFLINIWLVQSMYF